MHWFCVYPMFTSVLSGAGQVLYWQCVIIVIVCVCHNDCDGRGFKLIVIFGMTCLMLMIDTTGVCRCNLSH